MLVLLSLIFKICSSFFEVIPHSSIFRDVLSSPELHSVDLGFQTIFRIYLLL